MAEPAAPKRDNVLTRKIGPLPMWAWTAIVLIIVIGYALLQNRKQQAAQAATGSQTDASQVPQFVNQTYTTVLPPAAPGQSHPGVPTDNDNDDRKRRPPKITDTDVERAPKDRDRDGRRRRRGRMPPVGVGPGLHNTGFPVGGVGPVRHPRDRDVA